MKINPDSLLNLIAKQEEPRQPIRMPTVSRRLNSKAPQFILHSGTNSTRAVLLRVTRLQAMQPVKFSGSAADFPVFRKRIRDDLEDGLLSDAQKIEFLPKFVTGDAYDVVARSAGCSYEDIVAN